VDNNGRYDLSKCRLFKGVGPAAIDVIMRAANPLKLAAGQPLFERGDDGVVMYVVLSGRLEVFAMSESGRKVSLNLVRAGECIGEISMFDGIARSASIAAQEDTVLQPISKNAFTAASALSNALSLNMIEILCERFRWVSSSVEDFAMLSLERRLARRLLLLDERFSNKQGEIAITQNDLADFVGASREATNKVLMQWKSFGLVDLRRGTLKLMSRESLDRMANDGYQISLNRDGAVKALKN
jgi:CRP/FNR family transcriptional regulator, cyclic AMP receptor protein